MSQSPPPPPGDTDPFPHDAVSYQSALGPISPAAKQLRLAVTFNYISAGLDGAMMLLFMGLGILMLTVNLPRNPGDPPPELVGAIYLGMGVLALILGIVKLIATNKLRKASPGAWGWGLAAGIIGTCQILACSCCLVQPAFGIYTIIVLTFETVRAHLRSLQAEGRSVYG